MIIAHRGESYLAPENTMASINLAWEKGAKAVEIDIRLTSDNEIIVLHDKNTGRTGDLNLPVRRSTLLELKSIDVGIKKSPEFKGERIPTLKEVIKSIPDQGKLITEIKCGPEIIPSLVGVVKSMGITGDRMEFISYNSRLLSELKNNFPDIRMFWILDLDYYLPKWLLWINAKGLIRRVREKNLDGVDVWAGKYVNGRFVKEFRDQGFSVYTWTVNDETTAKILFSYGVDAVTTDRASWLSGRLSVITQ